MSSFDWVIVVVNTRGHDEGPNFSLSFGLPGPRNPFFRACSLRVERVPLSDLIFKGGYVWI